MALAATITKTWDDGKVLHAIGTLTPSGSYTTTGDTLNLATGRIKSSRTPYWVDVRGAGDFSYVYVPGSSLANGKVKVLTTSTGAEHAAAAYVAGVTSDVIRFYGMFVKLR